jgi:hypothetical protein
VEAAEDIGAAPDHIMKRRVSIIKAAIEKSNEPLLGALERIIMAKNIEAARDIVNNALAKVDPSKPRHAWD